MARQQAHKISILAELEAFGIAYEAASENEVKVRCPLHDDEKASASINIDKGVFKCYAGSCGASGDMITYFAAYTKQSRAIIWELFNKRYDLENVKVIEPDVIERYHNEIWAQKPLLKELYIRGVVDNDIRRHRLGHAGGRITIPIKNKAGSFVNVRRYLPGAPGADKFKNTKGRGKDCRLFPIEQMAYDDIVLCGGEIKAIVAARVLNAHKIGAVTATGGEGNWHQSLTLDFKDKRVWIMMDIDEGGIKAEAIYAQILSRVAKWIGVVHLPLDRDRYPHGDVNDFVASEEGDLFAVIQSTPQWTPPIKAPVTDGDSLPEDVHFSDAFKAKRVGARVRFEATITAQSETSFVIPRRIMATCQKDQDCCALCAVFSADDKVFNVSAESPAVLGMVGVSDTLLDKSMRAAIGIPKRCNAVELEVVEHYNAESLRVSPSLEITSRDEARPQQPTICIDCDAELNGTYAFTGRLYPHPSTQQATILASKSSATLDALSQYRAVDLHRFKIFRPDEWTVEAIQSRLDDIYADFEANVTRIYMRQDIHLMVDLVYHTAMLLDVDGVGEKRKGWGEILIIGDSAQGKTECIMGMMKHYQVGKSVVCKNSSTAGLIGGLQQLGTEWFVSWGVIPTNDKRLVFLEELKGIPREVISTMTAMRDSGVAELSKIKSRKTHARTRLIAASNNRADGRTMESYNFGVEAIRELIGAPEDVRRFDAHLIVSARDVDARKLAECVRNPPKVHHQYTTDLCRDLILWAWTRRHDQIKFDKQALDALAEHTIKMCEKYSETIPIVDRGSMRYKLARLGTAIAARTFSSCDQDESIRVQRCHIDFIAATLDRIYSSQTFGYAQFSEAARVTSMMCDAPVLTSYINGLSYPEEVREQLLFNDPIELQDIIDWTGTDRTQAQEFLSLMVRKRALVRNKRGGYHKTPDFIVLLRDMEIKKEKPPSFIAQEKY